MRDKSSLEVSHLSSYLVGTFGVTYTGALRWGPPLKTFAAAFLSLTLLAALPGVATAAAADTTKAKANRTAKAAPAPTRKVRSVVLRKAAAPVIPAVPTFGQVAGLHQVDDPLEPASRRPQRQGPCPG